MATIEQAEHLEQMVTASLTRSSARLTSQVGVHGLRAALGALQNAAHRLQTSGPERGKVSLQAFSRAAQDRDVVGLEAKGITREVKRELARHGVLFTVERGKDGQSWVHIQGKDAKLVAHALEQAEQALDKRIARREMRDETATKIKERVEEIRKERREQKHERGHGSPDLDAPEGPRRQPGAR